MEITLTVLKKKTLEGGSLCPVGLNFPEGLVTTQPCFLGSGTDEKLGGEQGEKSFLCCSLKNY